MSETAELLERISALKSRFAASAGTATPGDPLRGVEEQVQRGYEHNAVIERTLCSANAREPVQGPATLRLTARGTRLLRKGREFLQALRQIADDREFQNAAALQRWHHEAVAMIEVVLRTVQGMPAAVGAQLRMCEGLEVVLGEVEDRIARLCRVLTECRQTTTRIDELADYLRRLASQQVVHLMPLQAIADTVIDEARSKQPLRFLYASPEDPSRFAAAHGLTTAQVLARLLLDDAEWQPQLQLAVMAALVHDVGMTRIPADVLLTEGPLDDSQRRLIEKHTVAAESMLEALWPGGGWPIEVATHHHERNDGTGYPRGHGAIHLVPIVRLMAVCDVYAALCATRPHRSAFDTRTALAEVLLLAERGHLDQAAAERLLTLSFYPVGSAVELNDGSIGLVIDAPREGTQPDRPVVHIAADAKGQPPSWPREIDLAKVRDRSIVRSLRAEERLALSAR
jgi:HD-GYP domain-containing protein (c-di-GMP phosphodiesterase class II)